MYIIYCYKSPSNKYYVGLTNNEERRKAEHKKKGIQAHALKFDNCIRKYGFENLEYVVLGSAATLEEAKRLEIEFIKKYDSYDNGYNSTLGGDWNLCAAKLTEEQVLEIRDVLLEGTLKIQDIADNYCISKSMISDIKNNKRWKHLEGGEVISRKGFQLKGSANKNSKLTEEQVNEIRLKLEQKVPRSILVKEYSVSKTLIQLIATNQVWSHVETPEYEYEKVRNGRAKLNEDSVRQIFIDRKNGMSQEQIWTKYNVSRSTVQHILSGKVWKDIYEEMMK